MRQAIRACVVLAVTLPLVVACPGLEGSDPGSTRKVGNAAKATSPSPAGTKSTSPVPSGSGASASPGATGSATVSPTPNASGSSTTGGGVDQNTNLVPTATPLVDATSVPTEIPRAFADTISVIVYSGTPGQAFFAGSGRGFAAIAGVDKLGEFPSVAPGGAPFESATGVTGLLAAGPDGNGGAWVAGATSRTLIHLTGSAFSVGSPIALGFTPALLASDGQRVWLAGSGGEGLAVTSGATASVAFSEAPAFLASSGTGGVWAADGSATGSIRLYSAPGAAPSAAASVGGQIAGLDIGDSGNLWVIVKGATPRVVFNSQTTGIHDLALQSGEIPIGIARGTALKAWAITDKALYQIEIKDGDVLSSTRYPRTETWVPGRLVSDPGDRRKIYATEPAANAVRRLYTGS